MGATYTLALERLREETPGDAHLLDMCAFFGAEPISVVRRPDQAISLTTRTPLRNVSRPPADVLKRAHHAYLKLTIDTLIAPFGPSSQRGLAGSTARLCPVALPASARSLRAVPRHARKGSSATAPGAHGSCGPAPWSGVGPAHTSPP